MNLDIDMLRSFVAVAEELSFTRAAERVARTQSTVSVQIRNLEERLGFALFERTRRSVALTARGERLLAYARDILRLNDDGIRDVTAPRVQGRVRLGITEYFAPQHLPALLQGFRARYPGVDLEVTTGVTGTLRALQAAGELDAVIGRAEVAAETGRAPARSRRGTRADPGLVLCREPLHWVAALGLRVGAKTPVDLALLPPGCGIRALALAALEHTRRPWRAVYCGPSVLGVQAAVGAGLAVGCLTRSALREDFRLLGGREGLPRLPDSLIVLYAPRRSKGVDLMPLAELIQGYFSSAAVSAAPTTRSIAVSRML